MSLGPLLRRQHHAPYVLDFQDPWISPEGTIHRRSLKTVMNRLIHKCLEPKSVSDASGLMAVSSEYLDVLDSRYASVQRIPREVIPFGYSQLDTQIRDSRLRANGINSLAAGITDEFKRDLTERIVGVYTGAYVTSMEPMISSLFSACRRVLEHAPNLSDKLRLWFVGSNYSELGARSPILPLAKKFRVDHVVREVPLRIPFYDAAAVQALARFNILLGSVSRGYNPSKLFNLLESGRPVLAILQRGTFVDTLLSATGGAVCIHVDTDDLGTLASDDAATFLLEACHSTPIVPMIDADVMKRWSAPESTRKQADLFERAVRHYRDPSCRSCHDVTVSAEASHTC